MALPRLLTISAMAGELGVSGKTIRKWIAKYGLPHIKKAGSYWLPADEVEKWLKAETMVSSNPRKRNPPSS